MIIRLKRLPGQKTFSVFSLGQIAGESLCVASAVPRLDADKRRVFASRRPDAEQGRVKLYRHKRFFLSIGQPDPARLLPLDDQRIPVKKPGGEPEKAVFQRKGMNLLRHQALAVQQAVRKAAGHIKAKIAAVHSSSARRTEKGRMRADGEVQALFGRRILYPPQHTDRMIL